jgi:hypothetical protein
MVEDPKRLVFEPTEGVDGLSPIEENRLDILREQEKI